MITIKCIDLCASQIVPCQHYDLTLEEESGLWFRYRHWDSIFKSDRRTSINLKMSYFMSLHERFLCLNNKEDRKLFATKTKSLDEGHKFGGSLENVSWFLKLIGSFIGKFRVTIVSNKRKEWHDTATASRMLIKPSDVTTCGHMKIRQLKEIITYAQNHLSVLDTLPLDDSTSIKARNFAWENHEILRNILWHSLVSYFQVKLTSDKKNF